VNAEDRPDYPPELERAWLDMAAEVLGTESDLRTLDRLAPLAADLSDVFTTERQAGFRDYAASRDHWLAYGAFFFPQTFIRMRFVLEECLSGRGWRPHPRSDPVRLLDLGAGTGAATAAALATLGSRAGSRRLEVIAVDASETALGLLRSLHKRRSSGLHAAHLDTRVGSMGGFDRAGTGGRWDLITVSFALNEALESAAPDAAERWVREALSHLAPGGLLVMLEPALHTACERMERLRDVVSAQRLARIVAPCPHHLPCPMLPMPETWCHDVRHWRVPESVEYINRRLQHSVQHLKFCFLALAAEPTPGGDPRGVGYCRVVAPMTEPRGRICTFGCGADGLIHPYETQTRDLDHGARHVARRLDRGVCLTWRDARLLGDGRTVRGIPDFDPGRDIFSHC
jgi:SAM-dependent methyltransferase